MLRRLPSNLVNQIAAGEVVERPAGAVKELVENALDAGARRIDVTLRTAAGPSSRSPMTATAWTATSSPSRSSATAPRNCPSDDLADIRTFGFRGEALPSIGAVSRFTITTRPARRRYRLEPGGRRRRQMTSRARRASAGHAGRGARSLLRHAGAAQIPEGAAHRIERTSPMSMRRLAMAHPEVAFRLESDERTLFDCPPANRRCSTSRMPRGWSGSPRSWAATSPTMRCRSTPIREGFRLTGFAGLPTLNRADAPACSISSSTAGRCATSCWSARCAAPTRISWRATAIRWSALFLDAPPEMVDVNVHPAKTEVRFRDAGSVRGLIVGALAPALTGAGHRASTTVAAATLRRFRPHDADIRRRCRCGGGSLRLVASRAAVAEVAPMQFGLAPPSVRTEEPRRRTAMPATIRWASPARSCTRPISWRRPPTASSSSTSTPRTSGWSMSAQEPARAERRGAPGAADARSRRSRRGRRRAACARAAELAELGLVHRAVRPGAVVVREMPALLGEADVQGLVRDLADELAEMGDTCR